MSSVRLTWYPPNSPPPNPVAGDCYIDSNKNNRPILFNNGRWVNMVTGEFIQTEIEKWNDVSLCSLKSRL